MSEERERLLKWIAALRSGEYKQTREMLHSENEDAFCCLGVMCDLYAKEKGATAAWESQEENDALVFAGDSASMPPAYVEVAFGLRYSDSSVLSLLNDDGESSINDGNPRYTNEEGEIRPYTFSEIADLLEQKYLSRV